MSVNSPPIILIVIGQLGLGGAERHILRLVSGLRTEEWTFKVFSFTAGGALEQSIRDAGIEVITPKPQKYRLLRLISVSCFFLKTLYQYRPRLIHFFLPEAYLLGSIISWVGPRSIRVMSRRSQNIYQKRRPILGRLEHLVHKGTHHFTANSNRVLVELLEEGIDSSDITVIHNGISKVHPNDHATESVREKLGIASDSIMLVMVANLIPYKGHADLIESLGRLNTTEKWCVVLIGEDRGIEASLRKKLLEKGLEDKFFFLGGIDNIFPYLLCADIGILTSHEEGFSNYVIEGMACGLPMLVTDVGGNGEAVIHQKTGLVVPCKNSDAIAEALDLLMNNKELIRTYGLAGKERAEVCFSERQCFEKYSRMYLEILNSGPFDGRGSISST